MSNTCLQKVSEIYDQSAGNGRDIDPMVSMEDLEAAELVLEKHGEEATIGVIARAQRQLWLGAGRVVMAEGNQPLRATHVFEVARF